MPKAKRMSKRAQRASVEFMSEIDLPTDKSSVQPSGNAGYPHGNRKIPANILILIGLAVILYIGLNVWIYFFGTKILDFSSLLKKTATSVSLIKEQHSFGNLTTATPAPTPVHRILYSLPTGKQSWKFSYGSGVTGPKAQAATVDPLTPPTGGAQTVSVTVKYDSPVVGADVTVYTDSKHRTIPMKLTGGTATDGTWSATWTMDDTYDTIYNMQFSLMSKTGSWTGSLTFR